MSELQNNEPSVNDQATDCASRLQNLWLSNATVAAAVDGPRKPTSDAPKGWAKLPAELRIMILENVCSTRFTYEWSGASPEEKLRPRLAPYARVCREWQPHFESLTFRSLTLHQADLDDFQYCLSRQPRRIAYLRWIHLRLALREYDCDRCRQPENEEEQADNNEILTAALYGLFHILAEWSKDSEVMSRRRWPLELEMSAHAQSDWSHSFKLYKYRADGCQTGRRRAPPLNDFDFYDSSHGWEGRRTFVTTEGECLRVLGGGLKIESDTTTTAKISPTLPVVPMVGSFLIRRQFYRRFEAVGCLDRILAALPNLVRFRYEPWGAIPSAWGKDADRRLKHYCDLVQILEQCPNLVLVSIYEDSEDFRAVLGLPRHRPPRMSLAPAAFVDDAVVGAKLAEASQPWRTAHLSHMVEAAGFLHSFWPGLAVTNHFSSSGSRPLQWENLMQLSLTSDLLSPLGDLDGHMEMLLQAAARAAMAMPKLQCLTLWTAGHRYGCYFRYLVLDGGTRHQLSLASTWNARLSPWTRQLWEHVVARKMMQLQEHRSPFRVEVQYLNLRPCDMGTHGALLPLLRDVSLAAPNSQLEMMTQSIVESDLAGAWRSSIHSVGMLDGSFWMHINPRRRDTEDEVVAEDEDEDENGVLDVEFGLAPRAVMDPRFPPIPRRSDT
ncbi:hypothetical protein PG984_009720 [Apiospora sp. TS-2023a]